MIQDTPQHCGEPKLVVETAVKKNEENQRRKKRNRPIDALTQV